jgi:hypothetical protein
MQYGTAAKLLDNFFAARTFKPSSVSAIASVDRQVEDRLCHEPLHIDRDKIAVGTKPS